MDLEEKKNLFREEAVKSKETKLSLGTMMVVVTSKAWIALLMLMLFLLVIVVWAFIGQIPDEVSGSGFVVNGAGNFIIESPASGKVEKIYFHANETLEKEDLIMTLVDPSLEAQIDEAKKMYTLCLEQKGAFTEQENKRVALQTKAIIGTIEANETLIEMTNQELEFLNQEMEWQKELHQEGLITLLQINQTQIKINQQYETLKQCKIAIDKAKTDLVKVQDLIQLQNYQDKIEKAIETLAQLQVKKELQQIKAPSRAKVITIPISVGNLVKEGDRIFWGEKIETEENRHQFYTFLVSEKEQRVRPGMLCFIRLESVDYKLYGELIGEVVFVSDYPVSSSEIYKIIGNNNIVNTLTSSGAKAPLQVIIRPLLDKNTPSGYQWTSEKGPPDQLESGVLITTRIRIRNRHPVEYILPIIRNLKKSIIKECTQ